MQVMLEIAVTGKAQAAHDADDRRRISLQALRHRTNAQQHVFSRMLKNRPDDFLKP